MPTIDEILYGKAKEEPADTIEGRIAQVQAKWTASERAERMSGCFVPQPSNESVHAKEEFIRSMAQHDNELDLEWDRQFDFRGWDHHRYRKRKRGVPWWWPMLKSDPAKQKNKRK